MVNVSYCISQSSDLTGLSRRSNLDIRHYGEQTKSVYESEVNCLFPAVWFLRPSGYISFTVILSSAFDSTLHGLLFI